MPQAASNKNDFALMAKTTAVSIALIALMAQMSSATTFINISNTALSYISLFLFASVGVLAVILMWSPRFLKESAMKLCAKHGQIPANEDAYYVMFLRQFGSYVLFLMYAIYLHPDILAHFWKVMSAGILIKCWHVQSAERPIPLAVHVSEIFLLAFIGLCATLYSQQVIIVEEE